MPAGACAWARGMTPASRSAMPAPTMTRSAVRFIGHPPEFCGDAGNRPEPSGRARLPPRVALRSAAGQPSPKDSRVGTPRRCGLSRAMSRSAPVGQALQPEPVVTQGLGALLVALRLGDHADAVQLAHRPAVDTGIGSAWSL